jgi:methylmalonyl-CoA mutase N-terminal domain/subunit
LADAAYRQAQQVERGERVVVGVNRFPTGSGPLDVFRVDPGLEADRIVAVRRVRAGRDEAALAEALAGLVEVARGGDNVVQQCVRAVTAGATLGEIVTALRRVFGSWQPSAVY